MVKSIVQFLSWMVMITVLLIGSYIVFIPHLVEPPLTLQALIIFCTLFVVTLAGFVLQLFAFKKFPGYSIHIILLTLIARMLVFAGINLCLIYFFKNTAVAGVILFFIVYLLYTILELIMILKHTNWLVRTPPEDS